jgi:hypothetical protein
MPADRTGGESAGEGEGGRCAKAECDWPPLLAAEEEAALEVDASGARSSSGVVVGSEPDDEDSLAVWSADSRGSAGCAGCAGSAGSAGSGGTGSPN